MITVWIRKNAGAASRPLQYSDYLDEERRTNGQPTGRSAERLDITGPVANEAPEHLKIGRHPEDGKKIQQCLTTDTEHGR